MKGALLAMAERIDPDWFRWAIGILVGIISSAGAYKFTAIDTRMDRTDNKLETVSKDFYERGQRISSLETHVDGVNRRLERIEEKQDIMLEKLNHR